MRGAGRGRPLAAVALAVAGSLALAGCSSALGSRYRSSGSQQNYIPGDGSWKFIDPADRGRPVTLTGKTADGTRASVASWRGDVVVVNVWYAACGPCRAEAPDLAAAATSSGSHVHFLGINTEDSASEVQAFDRRYSMPYPSVLDADSGAALLALRGVIPPSATPSTIVLDGRGRPAARIVGRLAPDVLEGLVDSVRRGTLAPSIAKASASAGGGA